jgi:hypothetical protein
MRFTILITAAISVLAFVSQSASALPIQDSHRGPSQLSKRQLGGSVSSASASPGPDPLGSLSSLMDSRDDPHDGLGIIFTPLGVADDAPPGGGGGAAK